MPIEADTTAQTAESESLSLGLHEEVQAVAVAGSFSSAQVHFVGPNAWISPTISVRLYGRCGGGRLLLAAVALASTTYTQEGGTTTALALVVRGIQVEGFEVVIAQDDAAGVAVTNGTFVLVAKASSDGADIRPGLPAHLQPFVAQGMPAEQASRWPVYLTDGTAEVGSTNALHVRKSDRRPAYYVSAYVGSGTSSVEKKSILYVASMDSLARVEIRRITISYLAGMGGNLTVRGSHIYDLASPPGGTPLTPLPFDPRDAASAAIANAGADSPTRVALPLLLFAVPFSATGTFVWTWTDLGKPIVLPESSGCGFEISVDVSATATTEMKLYVSIEWLEI